MVSIAGSKKLKRQMAPLFWRITRKDKRFVTTVRPGPHPRHASIPLAVLLRDTLKVTSSSRESKTAIYSGSVRIDGVKRKSLHHGAGLMDVIELENVQEIYRLVPKNGEVLVPIRIPQEEKSRKLCKITQKTTIRGGRTQIGLHDGRSVILSEKKAGMGDTCLLELPGQEILDIQRLEKGCTAMVTGGINAGSVGRIEEIKPGTFVLDRTAVIRLGERTIEIPTGNIMAVGGEKPLLEIG